MENFKTVILKGILHEGSIHREFKNFFPYICVSKSDLPNFCSRGMLFVFQNISVNLIFKDFNLAFLIKWHFKILCVLEINTFISSFVTEYLEHLNDIWCLFHSLKLYWHHCKLSVYYLIEAAVPLRKELNKSFCRIIFAWSISFYLTICVQWEFETCQFYTVIFSARWCYISM